ncbi:hypothetical protein [Streptosporangium fragile]|uniref:hypothetical protein n=1 Tax=Streptosporangium fragile TaxID=46186 RepID=UPI0031EB6091
MPSVTGYVHRLHVDDRELFAKYSVLGVSLVSLLRGAYGDWPQVRRMQAAYILRPDALLTREAAQLRFLGSLRRPQVCAVAGASCGVLFTEPVTGESLARLLLARPHDAAELLGAAYNELDCLHRPRSARSLARHGVIDERSITGTFLRKFSGTGGAVYIDRLGAHPGSPAERDALVAVLHRVVARLRRDRTVMLAADTRTVLAYGDLKPEHVLFPDGPAARPVFIDPGLLRAGPCTDAAKLISRTILMLISHRPGQDTVKQVTEGLAMFAAAQVRALPDEARDGWLRELLALWLMDTINILSTYLSAPAELPIPTQGHRLVRRATAVCAMADAVSRDLAAGIDPRVVWERGLPLVQGAAL